MSLTLTRHTLALIARACGKLMTAKNRGLPILQHLHLSRGEDGRVQVTATNLEERLTYTVPELQPGPMLTVLLPFAEAQQLGQGQKNEGVEFRALGPDALTVTTVIAGQGIGRTLPMPAVEEFPSATPDVPVQPGDVEGLLAAYRRVRVACSTDQTRLALNGVYLDPAESVAVATDGRRLLSVPLPSLPLGGPVLLPITKVLTGDLLWTTEGQLGFVPGDDRLGGWLRLVAAPWDYRVRTLAETYPHYQQVIPRAGGESGSVILSATDVETLTAALKQFPRGDGVLLYGDATSVVVATPGGTGPDGALTFHQVVLPTATASLSDDQPVCVELNRQYLLDGVQRHCLRLRCRDALRPVRAESDDGALYVIMPLRVDRALMRALQAQLRGADHVTIPEQEPAKPAKFIAPPTRVPVDAATPEESAPVNNDPNTPPAAPEPAASDSAPTGDDITNPTGSEAGSSGLRMLPPTDPLADWLQALDEVEEQAKALVTSVRDLRRKARDVSRAQRGQEKEFKSAAAVIDRLKKVANF